MTEETVGQRIRRLRLARKLSQRALSAPGVSWAYISRIESGERQPSLKALRLIADKLGVDVDYLETGEELPAAKERELRLADAELELRIGRDLDRAEKLLRALLAENVHDRIEIRVRAALGTLAARRGDNAEAIRQLEAVISSGRVRPETRPDVYETLSTAYVATGAHAMAISLLESAIDAVDADERNATQQVRFRSFLGTTLSSMGALDRARAVLQEATERADRLDLPHARVSLYWTQSAVEWMDANADAALAHMGRALGLLEASEDTLQVARAHLFLAQIYNFEHAPEEAGPHLERAERLLDFGVDNADFGVLRAEQAKHAAQLGDVKRAHDLAHEAVSLLVHHIRYAPAGWHAVAAAHAAAGDVEAADSNYRLAVAALAERRQWREAIQISREWAGALRAAGRDERALEVYAQATVYGQRGAPFEAARRRGDRTGQTADALPARDTRPPSSRPTTD